MKTTEEYEALLAEANERIKQLEQRLLLSSEAEKGENLPQFCQSTMKENHGVCLMPTNSCQQCKWTDKKLEELKSHHPVEKSEGEVVKNIWNKHMDGLQYKEGMTLGELLIATRKAGIAAMIEYAHSSGDRGRKEDDRVERSEYEHALNEIGQLQERLKDAEDYIRDLQRGTDH